MQWLPDPMVIGIVGAVATLLMMLAVLWLVVIGRRQDRQRSVTTEATDGTTETASPPAESSTDAESPAEEPGAPGDVDEEPA